MLDAYPTRCCGNCRCWNYQRVARENIGWCEKHGIETAGIQGNECLEFTEVAVQDISHDELCQLAGFQAKSKEGTDDAEMPS